MPVAQDFRRNFQGAVPRESHEVEGLSNVLVERLLGSLDECRLPVSLEPPRDGVVAVNGEREYGVEFVGASIV